MSDSDPRHADMSMSLYRSHGQKLISAEGAKEIALMVTRDAHGPLEAEKNLPLTVRAEGENWIVEGANSKEFNETEPPDPKRHGPLRMTISSFDGQILEYSFVPLLPGGSSTGTDVG